MNVYIVTVKTPLSDRYIDSMYVVAASAERRAEALNDEFKRTGKKVSVCDWFAWPTEAIIEDAELKEVTP